ncbi:hypothetical protein C8J57DRAFT_1673233 [Mycena rebaudengoi]|nr:hypothetical protein C8J57DRAFT_1673233 [Mycena rebaudengoi]
MAGTTDAVGPSYISSNSADVILSDIRPIKLKLEALRSINSESPHHPSGSLGKEALLEAEVELRAYRERTARPAVLEDDADTFNLQWAFKVCTVPHVRAFRYFFGQLLRLKCEAYSTLNELDENTAAVGALQEKMAALGDTTPPSPTLVAPASLYLTARPISSRFDLFPCLSLP